MWFLKLLNDLVGCISPLTRLINILVFNPVHTLLPEKREFNQVVAANPQSKALALILGAPTLDGPEKLVTDISPVELTRSGKNYTRCRSRQREIHQGICKFQPGAHRV